jgi:PAS domain S-box-containing protein
MIDWLAAAAAAAVFILDLLTPLGLSMPMLYVLPILFTRRIPGWRSTVFLAVSIVLLSWVGLIPFFADLTPVIVGNRGMTSFLLLVVAGLLLREKHLAQQRATNQMALRESEERFRSFFENAASGAAQINAHGRFINVNDRFCQITGYSREDLLDKMGPLDLDHPDDVEADRRRITDFFLANAPYLFHEKRYVHKAGHIVWVRVTAAPIRDDRSVIRMTAAIIEDITERKQAEERLRESEERFAKAFRTSPNPIGITEVATGRCIEVNEACLQVFGFCREEVIGNTTLMLGIWPNQEDRERLVERLKAGEPVRNLELSFKTKSGAMRHILVSSDLAELSGTLCLITVGNDITERKRAEDKARRTADDLAEAQRTAKLGTWRLDIATNKVLLSNQLYDVFDVEPSPLGGEPYESFLARVHPDDRPGVVQANVEARAHGTSYDVEFRIVAQNGSIKVMREVGYANRDAANRVVTLFGTVQDITDRKRVEEALRKAELYYRTMFQEAGVGVAQVDSRTGQFLKVNRKYCEMVGLTEDEMLATTFMAITHPDDLAQDLAYLERMRRDELSTFTMEKRYRKKDGSIVWAMLNVASLWQVGETLAQHIAVVQDISDRKQMETALSESEERFRHIFEYAGTGIAILNWTGRFVRCNPAYCKITGYSEEELSQYAFPTLIHQDDRDMRERHVAALMRGEIPFFNIELRYLTKSGSTVWVQKLGSLLRSEQGRATHYIVMVTDVTERKESEERLRLLNESLEQRVRARTAALAEANERWDWVVRATQDSVWDWDLLRDTAYFSPRWKEMHGFLESDRPEPTKEWATRIHPEDRPRVMDALERCRTGTETHFYEEYRIRRKDGTYMWVLDQGLAVFNDQGRAVRMIGAESDITALKSSEALLHEREAQLRELSARLLKAQEEERRRISMDLHDDVMQRMGL